MFPIVLKKVFRERWFINIRRYVRGHFPRCLSNTYKCILTGKSASNTVSSCTNDLCKVYLLSQRQNHVSLLWLPIFAPLATTYIHINRALLVMDRSCSCSSYSFELFFTCYKTKKFEVLKSFS